MAEEHVAPDRKNPKTCKVVSGASAQHADTIARHLVKRGIRAELHEDSMTMTDPDTGREEVIRVVRRSHSDPYVRTQHPLDGKLQCYQVRVLLERRDEAIRIIDEEFAQAEGELSTEDILRHLNEDDRRLAPRAKTSTTTTIVYLPILLIACALVLWYSR